MEKERLISYLSYRRFSCSLSRDNLTITELIIVSQFIASYDEENLKKKKSFVDILHFLFLRRNCN